LVCAHVCASPSCAASPAMATPAAPPSLPMFPTHRAELWRRSRAKVSGQGSLFFLAKRSLWGTHDSSRDVSPSRRPLPSPSRLSRSTVPFRPGVEHLVCRPKNPREFFLHTQNHTLLWPQSIHRIWCGRPIPSSPHDRPPQSAPRWISPDLMRPTTHIFPHVRLHHSAPQKIPAGSFAPRHTISHAGFSWLIGSYVAATSAPTVGLQPPNRQL
jgi:hypothetical protein